jgi:hypothetical protein
MNKRLAKIVLVFFILNLLEGLSFFYPGKVGAGNLTSISDTLDVSRSSWRTTLSAASLAGDTTFYLTSASGVLPGDTIKLWGGTAETLLVATVNSSSNFVTTTTAAANAHSSATDVSGGFGYDPTTDVGGSIARHTIVFTPSTVIDGGEVRISFPYNSSLPNDGKPDTDGFDFNSVDNISCSGGGSPNFGTAVATASAGTIVIPFYATLSASAVTCTVGSSTRATGNHMINPAKSAAAGTADTWTMTTETRQHPNYGVVDSGKVKVATVESVRVTALVNPTLSVVIAGISDNTSVDGETTNSVTSCSASAAPTATLVDLGTLSSSGFCLASQSITISTNGTLGYSLVAKDDGRLRDSAGDNIAYNNSDLTANDTPVPAVHNTSGTEAYGIHPCGADVNTSTWGTNSNACTSANKAGSGAATTNKYSGTGSGTAWQYYVTLASNTAPVSSKYASVTYKAGISGTTNAGEYSHIITYVVTATF